VVLGDVIANLIGRFVLEQAVALGGLGTFDTFILATFTGIAIYETIEFIKERRRIKKIPIAALNLETAEDMDLVKLKKTDDELFSMFEGE